MIVSFRDKLTEAINDGKTGKGFPANMVRRAEQMLTILDSAVSLDDLRSPPGNRLEKLKGKRMGQHSVRLNSQWRICFVWTDAGPENVEICDYH